MPLPHPWRQLRELAHVTLQWHEGGKMGQVDHGTQTVSLRLGLTWEERRCTLLHELLHLDNGPQPFGLKAKEEETVRRQTAREMLPDIWQVGEALAWAHTPMEAAEELGVDLYVLRKRLRHLHPSELHYLERRLAQAE
ncbi:hypothetical protein [Nocardioides panaciterrulae]|uniref:ImmA/IrrE family metallo-endopeptidase n=1 Tax=Nocardioides panaciterrulae TaxID=661492 RepID=A0A7Y9EAS6_9ACTN|nr:hypothetical protein [Nocardioides panaciterrulae]NYD39953.1 hypothetical protein [Nocardioides panaciterrulae]NYD43985.1 hypothetical protein [Nocardioides panaciterrulae]